MWLKYLLWYWKIASRPEADLEDYFEAPIVETSWRVKLNDKPTILVKFGLLWKLFDFVGDKGIGWVLPILGPFQGPEGYFPIFLFGGMKGKDFLVQRVGVNQPHVGKGVIIYKTVGASERITCPDYERIPVKRNCSKPRKRG